MRFLPVTLNALLVELADLEETLALLASLQRMPLAGVEELVPAARTILVRFRPTATSTAALVQQMAQRDLSLRAERNSTLVEIPVHYNGEDLAEVAQILGITPEEVVHRHTGSEYTQPERAAPQHAAHAPACGLCGPGRHLQRGVPAGKPWRVANHRHHARGHVGHCPRATRVAAAGLPRALCGYCY
jgi:hypothetical protein